MTTDIRSRLLDWKARACALPGKAKRAAERCRAALATALHSPKSAETQHYASDAEIREVLEQLSWVKPPEAAADPKENMASPAPALRTKPRKARPSEPPTAKATDRIAPAEAGEAAATVTEQELKESRDIIEKRPRRDIMREFFTEEDLALIQDENTHVYERLGNVSLPSAKTEEETVVISERSKREAEEKARAAKPKRKQKPKPEPKPEKIFTGRDYRPIRRHRYYRTGLQGGLMYFGFVVCVSVILASIAWLAADDVLSLNKDEVEAQIFVGEDINLDTVASELQDKGIVKYKVLFELFGKLTHADEKIEPGIYTISSKLDYNAMIHVMKHDEVTYVERETVRITIPEGKTLKQTFQILAEHGVCPYETLLDCAANHEFRFSFLEDIPYGDATRLEGYLFPDTYEFYASSTPEEAISKFLNNFDGKFSDAMKEKAAQMGYSMHEIVTIASLIEMEAGNDAERGTIASVIYNRLNSSYYPYLQIDATIQYVLEERKEYLTEKDLAVDNPYNTYKYKGIPPGPISNPGLASLRSALNPENTGYYFYALNKNGVHNFFASYNEFLNFKNSNVFGG